MGKLNVAFLRYLTAEDFRVLTAVNMMRQMQELFVNEPNLKMNC